jgi:Uma2 family endonuclease
MTTAKPGIKLTYEDYCNAPEDVRYELLDGELVIVPSPKEIHQRIQLAFGLALALYVQTHALGRLYFAPFDVLFTDSDVVQPDLIFVSNERAHVITEDNIQGAPDLLVEVHSPSTADRDKDFKRGLYERHGVAEYWMVDPYAKTVTVLRLGEDGYETATAYNEGQTLESSTLVGFTLALGDVL